MFKISTRPRIRQRVKLNIEVDGEQQDHSFTATYQLVPMSETVEAALNTDEGQQAFIRKAVVGLDDLVDKDEKPVPFTPELLGALVDRPEVRVALVTGYFEAAKAATSGN